LPGTESALRRFGTGGYRYSQFDFALPINTIIIPPNGRVQRSGSPLVLAQSRRDILSRSFSSPDS
jgi:hypothetical protein